MSSVQFELEATLREDKGKGASRRLRHTDKIPAIVYGAGEEAISLSLDHKKTQLALSHEAFYSHILTLKTGKKAEKVILKAIQRHPFKPRIQHIDFLRVRADQKLQMHIPLHFIGDENCIGVKEGGVISHLMSDLEVSCLPANLPEFIQLDISHLGLDQTLHLSDIPLPNGVELTAFAHGIEGHDLPVVSVHIPHVEEEPLEEAAGEETEEGISPDQPTASGDTSPKENE